MKKTSVFVSISLKIEKVLAAAVKSAEFKKAKKLQELMILSQSLKSGDEKIALYFSIVGIDSKDHKAVMNFIGARNESAYIESAARNLDLTPAQADVLVKKITVSIEALISQ